MAVHIIKAAQNKATIINSSVGLLLTKEYFTVTGCYGTNKYAYIIGHNHGLYCHGHIFYGHDYSRSTPSGKFLIFRTVHTNFRLEELHTEDI